LRHSNYFTLQSEYLPISLSLIIKAHSSSRKILPYAAS